MFGLYNAIHDILNWQKPFTMTDEVRKETNANLVQIKFALQPVNQFKKRTSHSLVGSRQIKRVHAL